VRLKKQGRKGIVEVADCNRSEEKKREPPFRRPIRTEEEITARTPLKKTQTIKKNAFDLFFRRTGCLEFG